MHQYLVAKLLFIQSVTDTIYEGLKLEQELSSYLPEGLILDITVVRECMTGLEQLKYSLYDAIIVHSNVDYLTGQELVRILRVLGDDIPVLLITDPLPRVDLRSYANHHGFSSVLVKPINPQTLINEILRVMDSRQNHGFAEPNTKSRGDESVICN
jgi:DNA-binding response OmpR family regulator